MKHYINYPNLLLLCKECHNKEHECFTDKKEYKFDEDGNMVKKQISWYNFQEESW